MKMNWRSRLARRSLIEYLHVDWKCVFWIHNLYLACEFRFVVNCVEEALGDNSYVSLSCWSACLSHGARFYFSDFSWGECYNHAIVCNVACAVDFRVGLGLRMKR
jgi:hypothetical protein